MNLRFVFSLIVSLLSLLPAAAQDLTRNWIRERIFLDAEGKECVTSVQYFDGIGRETLLLTDGLSPGGDVACSLSEQSFAGRSSAKWLPATGLTGFDFLTPERVKSLAVSSHEGDSVPFSLTRRDALGRVSSVRNAGGDLAGKAKYRFFVRDRLGSVRSVADEDGNVLQQNLYYARGGAWGDVCTAPGFQSYKYCGKYLDRKHGLDLYDYGARLYDPAAAFWTSPDPLCEKYYNISPYAFCNDNPVRFIDPTGMEIEEGSLKEWVKLKQRIEKQRDKLQSDINKLNAKAEAKGWSSEKLAGKIGNKAERLASLNSSIGTMGTLEGSTQVYSLSHTGYGENGGVTLNTSTNVIDIKFGSTANFVHEMTHAGQFETGDVAFSNTGMSLLQDIYDETAAYKAQFGYSPSSVSGLTSTSVADSFGAITPAWVQGLKDATGSTPYAVGGSANTGLIPVNINSTRDALIQAYPWNAAAFRGLPANYNIRTLQGIYYKR